MLAHSLFGCAVYGAFAAKVTILRLHRFPKPVLPIAGGLLFAMLIGVWYTSALWLYRQSAPARRGQRPARSLRRRVRQRARAVFKTAGCGSCHTLAAAGSHGQVGPNLDTLRPVVRRGAGPGREAAAARCRRSPRKLTPAQIRDVAAFVATRAGG